jgi:8-oxo-dGTP diphosphatase
MNRLPQVGVAITIFPLCPRTLTLHTSVFAAVLRGKPPGQGHWSLPGGKVNFGEGLVAAAVREAREELGVAVVPLLAQGVPPAFCATDAIHGQHHYALVHVCAAVRLSSSWALPALVAGDDAAGAEWVGDGRPWGGGARLLADTPVIGDVAGVVQAARDWLHLHRRGIEGGKLEIR